MNSISKKLIFASVLVALELCSFAGISVGTSAYAQAEIIPGRLTVSVESMSALTFYPGRTAPANVTSVNISRIPAEISAVVKTILVRVGDIVEAESLLAELDCRQAQLNFEIESARSAQLAVALEFDRRDLIRREKLIAGGNIGEAELDRSQNLVISNENQLAAQQAVEGIAELNTQRCSILAPYAGVVTERLASEGERLAIGQAVVELVQLDQLEIIANIALDDLGSFAEANAYSFEENGNSYPLELRSLLPIVASNSRLRVARFSFLQQMAVTGSSGRVVWETPYAHVPARFLQLRNNVLGIFVLENNRARFIELSEAQEGRPVLFNVSPSTLIVTDGRFGLVDGQEVNLRQ